MATFNPSDVLATVAGYGQLTVQQIRYWAKNLHGSALL